MSRPRGGYIGYNPAPAASALNSAAGGIWTLREAEELKRAGTWPIVMPKLPTISGLQLHLDASDASTLYDATTGGSLVAADGSVARWEDKSGNGRHATQGTAGNRPARKTAIQNGLDVLRFDGTDDFLSHSVIESDPSQLTLIVALSASSSGNIWSHRSEATRLLQLNHNTTGVQDLRFQARGSGSNLIAPSIAAAFDVFRTAGFVFDKTSGSHFVFTNTSKGTVVSESFSGETFTSTLQTIGATDSGSGYTSFAGMDLAEILIYDSALSDTDREAVENYLMAKWGIS